MPLIFSEGTGIKGFFPCSKPYKTAILAAIRDENYQTASDLFQQGHRAIWQRQPDGSYQHSLDKSLKLTAQEYERIAHLPPRNITAELVNKQCPYLPGLRSSSQFG